MLNLFLASLLAFLAGSVPSGWIIGMSVKGIDIRRHGSGNVGATNVFRVVGKGWGIAALIFDVLKGWLSAAFIAPFFYAKGPFLSEPFFCIIAGFAAVAGHNWTPWLGFKGGKGVATSLGVALGLFPKAALSAFAIWALILFPSGYMSVASIIAALSFPVWMAVFYRREPGAPALIVLAGLLALLILYRHRSNIERLRQGKENRLWKK